MLESDMEELIARYTSEFFPQYEFGLTGRQGSYPGFGRYDLLFEDSRGFKILMELKARPAKYQDADQLARYYEALQTSGETGMMLWLVATSIHQAVAEYLDRAGIEHSEFHLPQYMRVAEKYGYKLTPEQPVSESSSGHATASNRRDESGAISDEPTQVYVESNGEKTMSRYRGSTIYIHVLAELVRAAQYRGLTTYQDVAVIMGLPLKGSNMGRQIGEILGEIVEDEVSAGRPMLSAVIVGVSGRPGAGFFNFAKEIGRMEANQGEEEFWRQEREAVYAAWRRPLPKEV